jgi:hypothetical protein
METESSTETLLSMCQIKRCPIQKTLLPPSSLSHPVFETLLHIYHTIRCHFAEHNVIFKSITLLFHANFNRLGEPGQYIAALEVHDRFKADTLSLRHSVLVGPASPTGFLPSGYQRSLAGSKSCRSVKLATHHLIQRLKICGALFSLRHKPSCGEYPVPGGITGPHCSWGI